jgi:hypothetical protein
MPSATKIKQRRYLHFDRPLNSSQANSLVKNPTRVKSWAFRPMIQYIKTTKRVKREGNQLVPNEKNRSICYSSHEDAAIYDHYGFLLSEGYEPLLAAHGLSSVVTAFRPSSGLCNIHYADEVFTWIREKGDCVALAFDIKGFFDNLDHKVLKRQWSVILGQQQLPPDHYAVYKSLTKFAYVELDQVFRELKISKQNPRANGRQRLCTPEDFRIKVRKLIKKNLKPYGIPQGTPMSAVLSNLYMLEFDKAVHAEVERVGGFYRRYCDDMLCIVSQDKRELIEDFVMGKIREVCLEIQKEKTMRHTFSLKDGVLVADKPLQYLGFTFDGRKVLLRNSGLSRYYAKMRSSVRLTAKTRNKGDRDRNTLPNEEWVRSNIRRRKLNIRYSYLGRHNYISYAMRASRILKEDAIKKQVRPHWKKLNEAVRYVD